MKKITAIKFIVAFVVYLCSTAYAEITLNMPDGSITTGTGMYSMAYHFFDVGANPISPDRWNIVASDLTFQGQVNISNINAQARWNTWDGGAGTNLGAWFMWGPYAGSDGSSGRGVWMTGVQWTGGGDAATDIRHIFHMQDRQGTQPHPKYYTGPCTDPSWAWLNDWIDFKLVVHATSNTTGTAQMWIHNELVQGQGQTSPPPIDTFDFDVVGATDDLTNMRVIMWMINGNNPNNPQYTLQWRNVQITGTPVPAPGAILLGSIGVGLVGWLKRRRTI